MHIRINGLERDYYSEGKRIRALNHVNLTIPANQIFTLLGPSGCGKTTLLRCIVGLETPDAGKIAIGDEIVFSKGRNIFVPPEKRGLGMVFQTYAIRPHMNVFDIVACLPIAYLIIAPSMSAFDVSLEESSKVCGASPFYTLRRIVIPLLIPGIISGWILMATMFVGELTLSVVLSRPGTEVLAVQILRFAEDGLRGTLSALGIMMIIISSSLVVAASLIGKKMTKIEVVDSA
jgi:ABC-type molybdate transport system permease subunit